MLDGDGWERMVADQQADGLANLNQLLLPAEAVFLPQEFPRHPAARRCMMGRAPVAVLKDGGGNLANIVEHRRNVEDVPLSLIQHLVFRQPPQSVACYHRMDIDISFLVIHGRLSGVAQGFFKSAECRGFDVGPRYHWGSGFWIQDSRFRFQVSRHMQVKRKAQI